MRSHKFFIGDQKESKLITLVMQRPLSEDSNWAVGLLTYWL